MKKFFCFVSMIFFAVSLFAADGLLIMKDDIRLVYEDGAKFENASGYHLFVRKKDGIESIMLTETTKDPTGANDNYAYRAMNYNSVNGDEIRYLNGAPLQSQYGKYSLISSTVVDDPVFGKAFHIYIPSEIQYGYPWSRNGTVKIGKGTFINIRSFAKKYGDYTGAFADNPFMFNLGQPVKKEVPPASEPEKKEEPLPEKIEEPEPEKIELTDDYNHRAAETFEDIAGFNGGKMIYSKGPATIIDDINKTIDSVTASKLDFVLCVDATGSMKDDIEMLRKEWIPKLLEKIKKFEDFRIGLLLYRDYGDNFLYKKLPVKFFDFTTDLDEFLKNLNGFKINGLEGGDIPEAVYEALYAGINFYQWRKNAMRKIVLIGDAEPHPKPRGLLKISKDDIVKLSKDTKIVIDTIILPDNKSERGRK